MGGYEVVFSDSCLRIATVDNLELASWFGPPEMDHMRALDRTFKQLKRRNEDGVAFVNVVVGGVPRFSQEVRDEAARQTAEIDPRDLATAHLVLVDGLVGSAVRAFMSTTMLIGRPPHPTKVFGDISSTARWLAIQLGRNARYTWSEDRVREALQKAAEPMSVGSGD
jgi:hypothetical protein